MEVESLTGLKAAFEQWRSRKRYAREAIPEELLERARVAARRHGAGAVTRATKVRRHHLKGDQKGGDGTRAPAASVPAFSRVQLAVPAGEARPFAEVETPTGLKVRLFAQTAEAFGLLTSVLGVGATR